MEERAKESVCVYVSKRGRKQEREREIKFWTRALYLYV